MLKGVIRLMSAAAFFALAVSCIESEELADSTMDGFSSFGSTTMEVEGSTGVELVGLGVELDPHFLSQNVTRGDGATELDWKRTVVKRCTRMGVQRYRVMVLPNWWEPYNDDDDPDNFNWDSFTFDSKEMHSLYAVLDLAENTGADVTLVLWGCHIAANTIELGNLGRHFLADEGSNWVTGTYDTAELAESYTALVKYLKETKGYTCVKELTLYNEPDGNTTSFPNYIRDCSSLHKKLENEGLRSSVKLNLSDNIDNNRQWLVNSANNLKKEADLFNSHTYIFGYDTPNSEIVKWEKENVKAAALAGKNHFIGEFGSNQTVGATRQKDINTYERGVLMSRLVVNFLNAGAVGASYWSLIDQYYLRYEAYAQMQQLGLWIYKNNAYQAADLGGIKGDYTCRPQYYAYSTLTRFIRKGSKVYPLDTDEDLVAATAVCTAEGEWTYVIANGSDDAEDFELVNDAEGGMNECDVYQYIKGSLPQDDRLLEPVMSLKGGAEGFRLHVPANSVLVLTQIK